MSLWKPSRDAIDSSNMMHFMRFVNAQFRNKFKTYKELHEWSVKKPEKFWMAVSDFCRIKFSKNPEEILINQKNLLTAQWFIGSELNFAENLLRYRDDHVAIIYKGEIGKPKSMTYSELYNNVARLVTGFKNVGVAVNQRIVALMPNIPETIIAMLATTSIGAIWSSCSPDFGIHAILDRFSQITPKILITTDGYFYNGKKYDLLEKIKILQKEIPSIEKIIIVPSISVQPNIADIENSVLWKNFIAPKIEMIDFTQLPFNHPIYIMYSSGTTGMPKCIVHGAGGTLIQHLKELVLHTDIKRHDKVFYYTTTGWMMWNWFVSSLATGATLVLYDGSPFYLKPSTLIDLAEDVGVTVFGTSARYISAIEKEGVVPIETHRLSTLRTILSTGSPLAPKSFDYIYQKVKSDVCLSSISGGTDIISCFALGNPMLPVHKGELQCIGLGMKVEVYNQKGNSVIDKKGELVCTAPFPSMPLYFWQDPDGSKYQNTYFEKFPNVWAHGDFAKITPHGGMIIYGRSDTILNPHGVRIGTAEIYREVEKIPEILESVAVDQKWDGDTRIILFVKLKNKTTLDQKMIDHIKHSIKNHCSPHHVPSKIIQVRDIPKTMNGKIVELAVRELVNKRKVKNINAIANPKSLSYFKNIKELAY